MWSRNSATSTAVPWILATISCVVALICAINALIVVIVSMVFCISSACTSMSFMVLCMYERFIVWKVPLMLS